MKKNFFLTFIVMASLSAVYYVSVSATGTSYWLSSSYSRLRSYWKSLGAAAAVDSGLGYVSYQSQNSWIKYPALLSALTIPGYSLYHAWSAPGDNKALGTDKEWEKEEDDSNFSDKSTELTFDQLSKNSENFNSTICAFKTENTRIKNIAGNDKSKQEKIVKQAYNAYPIVHNRVRQLIVDFVTYKKYYGSDIEKKFYAQNMFKDNQVDVDKFIARLLTKRPMVFMGRSDGCLLRGKSNAYILNMDFSKIGTNQQKEPLVLEEYLSYDEMPIAALIGVSVPTYFINQGGRYNQGAKGQNGSYQEEGIYVGLVGARFEKFMPGDEQMETKHMLITMAQNTSSNNYGHSQLGLNQVWQKFYDATFPTYDHAQNDKFLRYIYYEKDGMYLDSHVYKKRMQMVIEPFLLDANERARKQGKKAYCFVVGLGLGVWEIEDNNVQKNLFVQVFEDVVENNDLKNISDINFSWINGVSEEIKNKIITISKSKSINIHFTQDNPAKKLDDENKLLVAMYAWDSNAYPGNEYWIGALNASGDPAAACCSTITELQNPLINTQFVNKIKWYGDATWRNQ